MGGPCPCHTVVRFIQCIWEPINNVQMCSMNAQFALFEVLDLCICHSKICLGKLMFMFGDHYPLIRGHDPQILSLHVVCCCNSSIVLFGSLTFISFASLLDTFESCLGTRFYLKLNMLQHYFLSIQLIGWIRFRVKVA